MKELRKNIPGYEGYYEVSNIGRVKSIYRIISIGKNNRTIKTRLLKIQKGKDGYNRVNLFYMGKGRLFLVHRLVGLAFITLVKDKPFINHKNGIKNDNRVENLEWCNKSENGIHSFRVLGRIQVKNQLGLLGKLNTKSKPIKQINLVGDIIKIRDCARDVERSLGYGHGNIGKCANHKNGFKTAYGFKREYV